MLGSIPKARFPESCISDGTSGLGCPARAMRLQGRRKAVAKGSRVSERTSADSGPACGAASAKNNLACVYISRAAQEALLGSYTGSTAAHFPTTQRTGGGALVLNSEMARAFVLSVRSSGRAAPPSGRAFALSVLGNGPSVRPLLLRSRSLFAAYMPCLLA